MNRDRIDIGSYSIFPMQYMSAGQWFTKYLLVDLKENTHEWFYNPISLIIKLARLGILVQDKGD